MLVCLDLVPLSRLTPKQYFTHRCPVNYCISTYFGENHLALGSKTTVDASERGDGIDLSATMNASKSGEL